MTNPNEQIGSASGGIPLEFLLQILCMERGVVDNRAITPTGVIENNGRSDGTRVVLGKVEVVPATNENPGIINVQYSLEKYHEDPFLASLEYKVISRLHEAGVRVVRPVSCSGQKLTLEPLYGDSLKEHMLKLDLQIRWGVASPEQLTEAYCLFKHAVTEMSKIDALLTNGIALKDDEKEYLTGKQYAKMADAFGVSTEEAKRNFFAYRAINAFGKEDGEFIVDIDEFIKAYQPLAEWLERGLKTYGAWIGDEFTGNRIITGKTETTAIDFNNITFNPMQINDALLLMSYPNMGTDLQMPLFSGEQIKSLLEKRVEAWNNHNPEQKVSDFDDYFSVFCYATIHRAILQFGHAVDEARKIKETRRDYRYFGYAEKILCEAKYYLLLVYNIASCLIMNNQISEEDGGRFCKYIWDCGLEKIKTVQPSLEQLKEDYRTLNQ